MNPNIQYIREHIDFQQFHDINTEQLSQVKLNGEFAMELFKDGNRIIVDNGDIYYFYSPDLPNMSIRDILIAHGYENYRIRVRWALNDAPQNNVLDCPAHEAPVCQITIRNQLHVNNNN